MKALGSPWVLMILALVMHVAGYMGALMTHSFDIPYVPKPKVLKVVTIEEILESRSEQYNWYFKTEEIDKFVEELREREAALAEKEGLLKGLESHLDAERGELEKLKEEIDRRHKALSDQIMIVRRNEIMNLRSLATSYSSLSPEAAVVIFEAMDQALVVKIISLMKPDVVALIFEELARRGADDPSKIQKAARISEALRLHLKERTD
jgi:flagellar motility protein MotE (MotC chaperone)